MSTPSAIATIALSGGHWTDTMATYEQIKRDGKLTDRWRVRYRDTKDGNTKSIACPDEKTARALAGKIEAWACMNPGIDYPREGAPVVKVAMLDDVILAWLRDLARTKARRTVQIYGQGVRGYLNHVGKDSKVDQVTSTTIGAWDAGRVGQGVGENTRASEIGHVVSMWQWAWEHRADVAVGVGEPVRVERPATVQRPAIAPTWPESAACIAHLDPAVNGYRRAVVGYFTGLRTFQVTGMVYSDRLSHDGATLAPSRKSTGEITAIVDLDRGVMTVVKGKTKPETAMRRVVPLAPPFLTLLKQWHAEDPAPRVCYGNEGNAVTNIGRAWRMAVASGQARPEVFGPSVLTGKEATTPCHAFRRGLVTGLKRAGADTEAVEYLVGHAMPGVRGAYLDAVALSLDEAVNKIPPLPTREVTTSNVLTMVRA